MRIAVVLEHTKEPIEAHVDARRLNHLGIEWIKSHSPSIKFGANVAVRKKHERRLLVRSTHLGEASSSRLVLPNSRGPNATALEIIDYGGVNIGTQQDFVLYDSDALVVGDMYVP